MDSRKLPILLSSHDAKRSVIILIGYGSTKEPLLSLFMDSRDPARDFQERLRVLWLMGHDSQGHDAASRCDPRLDSVCGRLVAKS